MRCRCGHDFGEVRKKEIVCPDCKLTYRKQIVKREVR